MNSFFNDVNEWLSVGGDLDLAADVTGQDHKTTIRQLTDCGVTHVLDVRSEWNDRAAWTAEGLADENYAHLPIIDKWDHRPDEAWFDGVRSFVGRFLAERELGDRLYVHCHMGINRGPSAAMLALLVWDSEMTPWDAFLAVREAREVAGLVYAEAVGCHHLRNCGLSDDERYAAIDDFRESLSNYWTPDLRTAVHSGIAYYRDAEGGTYVVAD